MVQPPGFGPGGSPFVQILNNGALFKTFARSIDFIGATLGIDADSEGVTVTAGGVTKVSTASGVSVASVNVNLPSAPLLFLVGFLRPATDNQELLARVLVGGVPQTGANDYLWGQQRMLVTGASSNSGSGVGGLSSMEIQNSIGNLADEGCSFIASIYDPASTSKQFVMNCEGTSYSLDALSSKVNSFGSFDLNTNAVDGLQLFFTAGDIAEFELDLYSFA